MKVAAVSSESIIGNVLYNLQTTVLWVERLNEQGVDFILFPELNLSGYTKESEKIEEALSQKDFIFQELQKLSKRLKTAFAIGFPEYENGKYYISHFLFSKGKLIGKHRKTHLGPTEKNIYSEGNQINVFEIGNIKMGVQLCYESHFPEISFIQAKLGANLLTVAFASPNEDSATKLGRFKRFLPARAYDNNCFLMACNQNSRKKNTPVFPKFCMITDPKGNVLQETYLPETDCIIADIDLEKIERIKSSKMGWFNKYKREKLFKEYYS
nr:nitrilase-related carbon-nitrogen hydrolase [uncultured Draconibacterium sp.]